MFGKIFLNKLKEASMSVIPVTLIVFVLIFALTDAGFEVVLSMLISAILLVFGIALFMTGADSSMATLGSGIGSNISKAKHTWIILFLCFILGTIITIAEPDLSVLAGQVEQTTNLSSSIVFILAVSIGLGITFMLGVLKIIFKLSYAKLLTILYAIIFVLLLFTPSSLSLMAFDAGSVTTGALSVPFLLSFGVGFSTVRGAKDEENGLGLIGLSSVGPIITTLVLTLFLSPKNQTLAQGVNQSESFFAVLFSTLAEKLTETLIVLLPIIAMFVLFQIFVFKYPKTKVFKMSVGLLFAYVGISLFLTGVSCGYLPVAKMIGKNLNAIGNPALTIFIGVLLGAVAIIAEPALQLLKKQIETLTSGAMSGGKVLISIVLGVALAVGIATFCAIRNINMMPFLTVFYIASIILAYTNAKFFCALAFDSGGIATGTMAVSFILPLVSQLGSTGNGFGTIALIAVLPIFTMQIFGLAYTIKRSLKQKQALLQQESKKSSKTKIIEFNYKKH